jgi:hypothetical protein
MDKQPPFTTPAGIRIGCMYQPTRPVYHDRDALRLQDALLNKAKPSPLVMATQRAVRAFWAWC